MSVSVAAQPPLSSSSSTTPEAAQKISSDATWIDRQHERVSDQVDTGARELDGWFKTADVHEPGAQATLRIYMDNSWNEYSGIDTRLRLRGSAQLPNMNQRFRLVFGDDSLDDETDGDLAQQADRASTNQKRSNHDELPNFEKIRENAKDTNASLALRYVYQTYKNSGIDVDLGIRSGTDIYARTRLNYHKALKNDWGMRIEPMLRYGSESKLYIQQLVDFQYQPSASDLSDWYDRFNAQTVFRYSSSENQGNPADIQSATGRNVGDVGVRWSQRYNFHREVAPLKTLDYGVQLDGRIDDLHTNLDSYGTFVSYRQPVLRKWFFVRGELNYLNDRQLKRDWHPSMLVRLETHF